MQTVTEWYKTFALIILYSWKIERPVITHTVPLLKYVESRWIQTFTYNYPVVVNQLQWFMTKTLKYAISISYKKDELVSKKDRLHCRWILCVKYIEVELHMTFSDVNGWIRVLRRSIFYIFYERQSIRTSENWPVSKNSWFALVTAWLFT